MSENQNTQRTDKQNENNGTNGHENNKDNDSVIPEEFLNEIPQKDRKDLFNHSPAFPVFSRHKIHLQKRLQLTI
jgi:hypothetical protein